MTTVGLSKVVPHWTAFFNEQKDKNLSCICLLGTHNSGKSTLCQLFNAYIGNNKHQNLVFDDGKVKQYILPGIISANSLKVQTVKPVAYHIDAKIDNLPSSVVVDIPTFALPPFNDSTKKLWTAIDAKVSFNYLMKSIQSTTFVFVIDQKYTRAPMDGMKNILISFIDSFVDYPKELFESTALIISKCPAGFKLETFYTRVQALIKKIQDPNSKFIDQWFQNIQERKAVFAFNKFVTEQTVKEEIKTIYRQITKISPYKIDIETVKTFQKMKEDYKEDLKKYLNDLSQGFGGLIKIIMEIPQSLITNEEQFQNHKNQLAKNLFAATQAEKIEALPLPTPINILSVCFSIFKLANSENNVNPFSEMLNEFVKNKTLSEAQDLYIGLKQRVDFLKTFWSPQQNLVDWNYAQSLKNLSQQANKIKEFKQITKSLKDQFQYKKSAEYYQNIIELVNFLVPEAQLPQSQFFNVWINSNMEIAALLPKPSRLKRLLQIQSQLTKFNKLQLVSNLLAKIADALISVDRVGYAVSFYNKCGNPYKGIQQMSKIFEKKDVIKKKFKINDFVPYLEFLQDIRLYEKCYETCYLLGDIFETVQQRKHLEKFFNKPVEPKKQVLQSFLQRKVKGLDAEETKKIRQLADQLQKNGVV